MTKKKIIEILKTYGIIIDSNEIADELLILFKQELSERLEQLHTEMDERMREEVAIEKRMGEKKAEKLIEQKKRELCLKVLQDVKYNLGLNPDLHIIDGFNQRIEQEKKETAKEIISWFAEETEKAFGLNYLAERKAKEYGVEL